VPWTLDFQPNAYVARAPGFENWSGKN